MKFVLSCEALKMTGGVTELVLNSVLTEVGCLNLFAVPQLFHGLIAVVGKGAGARGAAAIGASDSGEPLARFLVASDDAMIGHEFEVVLMRADAEVGGAGESFGEIAFVWDVRGHGRLGWQTSCEVVEID